MSIVKNKVNYYILFSELESKIKLQFTNHWRKFGYPISITRAGKIGASKYDNGKQKYTALLKWVRDNTGVKK